MSTVSFILVYLMIWLIVFFMSLPFGIEVSDQPEKGNAKSAPIKTNLKLKFFLSFFIAFFPSILTFWIVEQGLFQNFIENI